MRAQLALLSALFLVLACSERREATAATGVDAKAPSGGMKITSPAFRENQSIPAKYGCRGSNVSPPLVFSAIPQTAKTLALIVEDPDAPAGTFTHWVVWNIPVSTASVVEGRPPAGGVEGESSYGSSGYGTLCPPNGEHRYVLDLFALDVPLNLPPSAGRDELELAMKGHILAEAQLMGRYRK
jgi:Raf kinase inhibitor-like YbhB/YbcL family protein